MALVKYYEALLNLIKDRLGSVDSLSWFVIVSLLERQELVYTGYL